jgi:two-component system CheB/CheR fusion protein
MLGIVGIGASAGGLEPLEQFLSQVPLDSGLAYVIVQHLDPTHEAMLAPLLQRATGLPVREVTVPAQVEPNVVYVIAPNTELTVVGGVLQVATPAQARGLRLPIDVLFGSLARDRGDKAVGVVLSGMGSDGTIGLQAIRSQGGLTLAQLPGSAQFDSMPVSAIDAGAADIVALPAQMPQHILRIMGEPRTHGAATGIAEDTPPQALEGIFGLLREHSKHDLSLYKSSTVRRRIGRRMGVHGLGTLERYEDLLRQNPSELDLLFKEMLIGVTGFFRDPAVWQELQHKVLPGLLAGRAAGGQLRAWVMGCSSGEEAYSLAMVFREVLDALPDKQAWSLQIFATDLSADAIALARRGLYSAQAVSQVGAQRLERFFQPQGGQFAIAKEIRASVLFAQHDVILDPPFTRLDILSCRNVMIYFNAPLQHRLLALFHYALRLGGLLLLGESETVGRSLGLFAPLNPKFRIYQRTAGAATDVTANFPTRRAYASRTQYQELPVPTPQSGPPNLQTVVEQLLLREQAPPAVLVNAQGDIVYVCGRTGRFLEPAAGKANWNIHAMVRPAIRSRLAAALRQALHEARTVTLHELPFEDDGPALLDITVQPLQAPKLVEGTALIIFRELAARPVVKRVHRKRSGPEAPATIADLARSQDEIRSLRQEMRASEEELQAANEELQSTNEELQATNEELTTAKEEAQSMNEELQTINVELQTKLDDLALAQSDMQNLLNSTDIATLFLDKDLNVRRYTDRITRIIHLREADVGRPLSDLASTLIYPELHADAQATLRTLHFCEKQVETTDGHWYTVRIMPYRTLANVIQGAVITLVDITAAKQLESRLRAP